MGGYIMAKPKTSSYQKRANDNYRSKHELIQLQLDLGERESFREVGMDNTTIRDAIRAISDYVKATGEDVQSLIDEFRQRAES
jgi:hypothetical protein